MKNSLLVLFLCVSFHICFSQELRFEVTPTFSRPVNKNTLIQAKTLMDINPGYPTSWVTDYISTELSVTSNDNVLKATGINTLLSADQKELLTQADLGTDIMVDVKYRSRNSVTGLSKIEHLHFSMSLIPEFQAGYHGGIQLLTQYLKTHAIDKISVYDPKAFKGIIIKFTINEDGEVANAQVSKTSEDPNIDQVLLQAITTMPNWRPAKNADGTKTKQAFVFSVGIPGC